jgi:hypothetical protein
MIRGRQAFKLEASSQIGSGGPAFHDWDGSVVLRRRSAEYRPQERAASARAHPPGAAGHPAAHDATTGADSAACAATGCLE